MKDVLKKAVKETLPVMFGYLFAGSAFGLMLEQAGYNPLWALFIGVVVYSGTMQYVLVGLLTSGASVISTIITTIVVNSRHLFYGLSFLEKFKAMGKKRWYMIFSLTDETYTLLNFVKTPEGMDEKELYFTIAALNQTYWITGSFLGALAGRLITFDITGVDFAMTALFVVIFVEKWLEGKTHIHIVIGLVCGIVSLAVFGPEHFIIPALSVTIIILLGIKQNLLLRLGRNSESEEKDIKEGDIKCQSR